MKYKINALLSFYDFDIHGEKMLFQSKKYDSIFYNTVKIFLKID